MIANSQFYKLRTDSLLLCLVTVCLSVSLRIHPVSGVLSVALAVLSFVAYGKAGELRAVLRFCLPVGVMLILFNLLFNRNGITVLFYLGDISVTLESVLYALCAGLCFAGTMLWFSFYCLFLDVDRVYRLFAGVSRGLGIVFSLSLSLVPKTLEKYNQMRTQNTVHTTKSHRLTGLVLRLSALISWAFEDAFSTALSMKARGATLPARKRQRKKQRFTAADFLCSAVSVLSVAACFSPPFKLEIYPRFAGMQYANGGIWYVPLLLLYGAPCMFKLWEVLKWKFLLQRI